VSQADINVTERYLKAFAAGDTDTMFGLIAPDGLIDEPYGLSYAGQYVGPAGLQELVGKIMTPMELTLDTFDVSDGGDCAVARMELTYTSRSSGRVVKMSCMELFETKEGKVSKLDIYYKSTQAIVELEAE
jgi:ketosteroid isomerase-like protein